MKKTIVIILVACLALSMAFAKDSNLRVGVQAGYGTQNVSVSGQFLGINGKFKSSASGFYFAGTAEIGVIDSISLRAEAGINTFGDVTLNETVIKDTASLQFSAYVGAQYDLALAKVLSFKLGAGLDMMLGKLGTKDDADINTAMGLGLEAIASYHLDKKVDLNLGAKFGWHFINTNDNIDDAYGYLSSKDISISNTTFKVFAGVSTAL